MLAFSFLYDMKAWAKLNLFCIIQSELPVQDLLL